MATLYSTGTWDLVLLLVRKSPLGCYWVYIVKIGLDGRMDHLKARIIAKGYTQIYGSNYHDTFSPVTKIASVFFYKCQDCIYSTSLYSLYEILTFILVRYQECFSPWWSCRSAYGATSGFVAERESVLVGRLPHSLHVLTQSPRAWFIRFTFVVQEFGMIRCTTLSKTHSNMSTLMSIQWNEDIEYAKGKFVLKNSACYVHSLDPYFKSSYDSTSIIIWTQLTFGKQLPDILFE